MGEVQFGTMALTVTAHEDLEGGGLRMKGWLLKGGRANGGGRLLAG